LRANKYPTIRAIAIGGGRDKPTGYGSLKQDQTAAVAPEVEKDKPNNRNIIAMDNRA